MKYYERNVRNHKKENQVNSGPFPMISKMKAAEFVYLRYLEDPDIPKAARLSSDVFSMVPKLSQNGDLCLLLIQ
jgi:hypothetical protein